MDTSSKGAKTYTARLGERILWDLHKDRDVYNEMWQIPMVPMPKERQVAGSISTKGEAVGSGDGANGLTKEIESKKCNLGGTSNLGEHEESCAAAKKQHKGEENPKAAAEDEYGESMWGTIASAAFSNPTSATGECDWLTLHRLMGHVALPILQQLVKNEMIAGVRVKGESDEVVGPFKLGAAGAQYFLTIVDIYTRMTWVYDEAMQEAERPLEILAQANYIAPVKQGDRTGLRGQSGGGGSRGWKPTKDADKKKSSKDSGCGGGSRHRECWLCGDPNHLSYECPDHSDSDDDDAKGGRERSGSRCPRRGRNQPRKEKQSTKSSTSGKDADPSASSKGRDDKEASCSLSVSGADLPCISCVGGKLARHTYPDQGFNADNVLATVHVDLPVAKKSDTLQEFVQWLAVTEWQTKKSVLMLRSDRGGEFLGKQFTNFVNGKRIVHDLTCPYTPQQNSMAEREMRTVMESVRTMLLHMSVQHHWWHLALRLAVWRGGKLKPKARWGLHLGVSDESKGWELLDIADNWVVTTSDVVFYENMSLEVYGADYDETYAPVSSYVTLRIFLSIVAVLDLNLMQLDMKNAFLQSKLDRVLYMYQPDYFNDGIGRVCKLLKSLYSLKQSPLLWYRALDGVLLGAGWKKSQVVTALYFKVGNDKVTCWVLVYVDDLLATSSSAEMLKEQNELLEAAFELLEAAFELLEISLMQKYLGLEIVRDRSTPVSFDAYATLTFDDEEAQERQKEEYRQKVGSLQFAATTMRPDIAFACSKLGSGLTVRSDQHWHEVDHCLAYLANTRDTALEFGGGAESLKLVGYVDANDAGDKRNRTSTGAYVFVYGGAAVSWSSQRIKCTTLSSTESERGRTVPPAPPAPGSTAPAPAGLAPPAPVPPTPTPAPPAPPAPGPPPPAPPAPAPPAPAAPGSVESPAPAHPTPQVPPAPAPLVRAPPGPVAAAPPVPLAPAGTAAPPAPVAPAPPAPGAPLRQCARRTSYSRSSCEDSRGEAPAGPPDKAAPWGSAPIDSAPSDSAPPGSTRSSSAPPDSAPQDPAPSDPAPPGSAPPDAAPQDAAPGAAPGTHCGRGLRQGDTGPKVELMSSIPDRKRPQKMGSNRMDHGGTSDLHD
ncbi:unnamed protein product [Closterium sp. NIES-54]